MYVYKARQKPFVPSNGFKSLSRRPTTPLHEEPKEEKSELSVTALCQDLVDRETGERISFTKAKWTPKEGRLSLNARIILDMGTGRLDIKSKSLDQLSSFHTSAAESLQSYNSKRFTNYRVAEFLTKGPLTPHMHVNWDPRTNKIKRGDDNSTVSEDLSSHRDFSLAISYLSSSVGGNDSYSYSAPSKEESQQLVGMIDEDQWRKLENKIFTELFATLEIMERNKSLTREEPFPGGIPALRKIAQQLAKLKVRQRRELVQALEDEQIREGKREQASREAWDKPTVLQDLKSAHQRERLAGRTYIEHLQKDHEVIFLRKMKELGFLW